MANTLSIREKYKARHTLVCLLRAVVGRITTVELRNECSATGYVDDVDGFMNVTMSKVLFVNMDGEKTHMDSFFVQASLVRYVQIPDDINMVKAMKRQLMSMNPQKPAPGSMSGGRKKPPLKLCD
ncbi:U7 snRNA-associated Sm-like protein LSm10 [Lytechinus pictus]|uniref:U7 snRNA-associated Sm-like protein LSm10 n=1 Tax=Lytechinus pictus TaxID=7653 RepID=UPI0030B9AE4C